MKGKNKYNPNDCPTGPDCFDCGNDCPGYNWGPNVNMNKKTKKPCKVYGKRHKYNVEYCKTFPCFDKCIKGLMCACGKRKEG